MDVCFMSNDRKIVNTCFSAMALFFLPRLVLDRLKLFPSLALVMGSNTVSIDLLIFRFLYKRNNTAARMVTITANVEDIATGRMKLFILAMYHN